MNIAIVGATGLVGRNFIKILEEKKINIDNIYLFASKNSAGKKIKCLGKDLTVLELTENSFKNLNINYALFSSGSTISEKYVPLFVEEGIKVIDNSSHFRMFEDIPLIVPEVNFESIKKYKDDIIANPNCSTIQLVLPLKALQDKYGLKRVIVSTYQSASGAGKKGIDDLVNMTSNSFPYKLSYNLIPHIDSFSTNNYTKEELKLIYETKKILDLPDLPITSTAVRVPTLNCHGESVNIELEKPFELYELKQTLSNFKNIVILDDIDKNIYPINSFVDEKDEIFIGRIRKDNSCENGVNLWIMADNIRKGAATNAVQILEKMIEKTVDS